MAHPIEHRYEFVLFFDVENGNPNGDPDAGNLPRIDPETSHGLVTDVAIKRKIRNYVEIVKSGEPGFDIYVREGAVLNTQHRRAYDHFNLKPEDKKLPKDEEKAQAITRFMCDNFYDIRTFGAVMTTKVNCGQVRGPVQMGFARSIDPIVQHEVTITRVAVTSEEDAASKSREMGRKHIVPYALYRLEGFVSASLAEKTGFSNEDLDLLWEALENMLDHDRSATRGKMASRRLVIFQHASKLGNAPAQKLFDAVHVTRVEEIRPPRSYADYRIDVDVDAVPEGVTVIDRLE